MSSPSCSTAGRHRWRVDGVFGVNWALRIAASAAPCSMSNVRRLREYQPKPEPHEYSTSSKRGSLPASVRSSNSTLVSPAAFVASPKLQTSFAGAREGCLGRSSSKNIGRYFNAPNLGPSWGCHRHYSWFDVKYRNYVSGNLADPKSALADVFISRYTSGLDVVRIADSGVRQSFYDLGSEASNSTART